MFVTVTAKFIYLTLAIAFFKNISSIGIISASNVNPFVALTPLVSFRATQAIDGFDYDDYLVDEASYTSILQQSIAELMEGVSTDDFTIWIVDADRLKLDTLSFADNISDIITSTNSFGRERIESSAVSAIYVITIQDSKSSYDELTSQLEDGLSNGDFNTNMQTNSVGSGLTGLQDATCTSAEVVNLLTSKSSYQQTNNGRTRGSGRISTVSNQSLSLEPRNHSFSSISSMESTSPSLQPTIEPTNESTNEPTNEPTVEPTIEPTSQPTPNPGDPTLASTLSPSSLSTEAPSLDPSLNPSLQPSQIPTSEATTYQPSPKPGDPTIAPTLHPSLNPSLQPTQAPTSEPTTSKPTPNPGDPTLAPTLSPSLSTEAPSLNPSLPPSQIPTSEPTTYQPSPKPGDPTIAPTTFYLSLHPSLSPTCSPSSSNPTFTPTYAPTPLVVSFQATQSIAELMDGVSTDDFTNWNVNAARRKLDTLSADTDSAFDIITSTNSFGRERIESSAVSAVYVITIQDSKLSYDVLTSQLEDGLSNGDFNTNMQTNSNGTGLTGLQYATCYSAEVVNLITSKPTYQPTSSGEGGGSESIGIIIGCVVGGLVLLGIAFTYFNKTLCFKQSEKHTPKKTESSFCSIGIKNEETPSNHQRQDSDYMSKMRDSFFKTVPSKEGRDRHDSNKLDYQYARKNLSPDDVMLPGSSPLEEGFFVSDTSFENPISKTKSVYRNDYTERGKSSSNLMYYRFNEEDEFRDRTNQTLPTVPPPQSRKPALRFTSFIVGKTTETNKKDEDDYTGL